MADTQAPSRGSGIGAFISRRSTTDLLILLIATTICVAVLAAGATVAVIEIIHPSADTSAAQGTISDVINTLIGLLAGFLAGRTQTQQDAAAAAEQQRQRESE